MIRISKEEFQSLMVAARRRVRAMDAIDARNGDAAPSEAGLREHLATAADAVRAGLVTQSFETVAEGLVMLDAAVNRLRRAA